MNDGKNTPRLEVVAIGEKTALAGLVSLRIGGTDHPIEHVAQCVNAHDELVAALRDFPGLDCDTEDVIRWMRRKDAAIAKATGEKP